MNFELKNTLFVFLISCISCCQSCSKHVDKDVIDFSLSTKPVDVCPYYSMIDKPFNSSKMRDVIKAVMIMSSLGDALAYKRGSWEFQTNGAKIHKEFFDMGGLDTIQVKKPDFILSDDSIMHLATAEALIEWGNNKTMFLEDLYITLATYYIKCMDDMVGRAPGVNTQNVLEYLNKTKPIGYIVPFNERGGGCGGAMRSMIIGLYFHRQEDLDKLIAVSIEAGRITHNHPTGYLGSLVSALFTNYAHQRYPIQSWGARLLCVLPKAFEYIESQNRDVDNNKEHWPYFTNAWKNYIRIRGIENGFSLPQFPEDYNVEERDAFYKSLSYNGWGGSSGHDAPMIAYDALLGSGNNYTELALRGFFHGGDSDSTAIIASAWFAVLYQFEGVPETLYSDLEYKSRIEKAADNIYNLTFIQN